MVAAGSFHILGANAKGANERVNVAFVGAGGRGGNAIKNQSGNNSLNIVAFADVDDRSAAETYKAHRKVPHYRDFRVMLDKHDNDIDAVMIATPDHSHHYITKTCMLRGKHVYTEKPLARTIMQCRELAALEKKTGLACQMGNQGHSGIGYATFKAWVDAGALGKIDRLVAWNPGGRGSGHTERPPIEPVPDGLDYDLWLGPVQEVAYSSKYLPGSWRWWFDFGNGSLGDWACHNMDAPYGALGLGLPSSVKVKTTGACPLSFPKACEIVYTFPRKQGGDVTYTWYNGPDFGPERPEQLGEGRMLGSKGGGTLVFGSEAAVMMSSHAKSPRIIPEEQHRAMAKDLPKASGLGGHFDVWLRACKGEGKTNSHFEYSARLTEVMHYGNIATHLDRDLKIDPKKGTIIGDEEATKLMTGPEARKGWVV